MAAKKRCARLLRCAGGEAFPLSWGAKKARPGWREGVRAAPAGRAKRPGSRRRPRGGEAALLAAAKPLQPAPAEVPRRPRPKRAGRREGRVGGGAFFPRTSPPPGAHFVPPFKEGMPGKRFAQRRRSCLSEGIFPVKRMQTSELAAERLLFLCAPGGSSQGRGRLASACQKRLLFPAGSFCCSLKLCFCSF